MYTLSIYCSCFPQPLGGPADYFGDENYWESVLSIGWVPLLLAILALYRYPERQRVSGWGLLTLLAIVFAGGYRYGIFPLLYELLPGMNRFRVPARALYLATLGASVLAGLGIETLSRQAAQESFWRDLERTYRRTVVVLVAALLLIVVLGRLALPPVELVVPEGVPLPTRVMRVGQEGLPLQGRVSDLHKLEHAAEHVLGNGVFWLALLGTGGILMLGRIGMRTPRSLIQRSGLAARLLGGLALAELGAYGLALIQVAPVDRFLGNDPISAVLEQAQPNRARVGTGRVRSRDSLYPDNQAVAHAIEKVNINDGFQLQHAADLYQTLYPLCSRRRVIDRTAAMEEAVSQYQRDVREGVLDRLGVDWLVSDHGEPELPWPVLATGIWDGRDFTVQQNPSALPRAYVVGKAHVAADDAGTALNHFRWLDPRQAVLMDQDPLAMLAREHRQAFQPARCLSVGSDRLTVRVDTEAPGFLVVADTWMPGSSAGLMVGPHRSFAATMPNVWSSCPSRDGTRSSFGTILPAFVTVCS